MSLISIDSSLTNCALIVWQDGEMVELKVVQTNNTSSDPIRIKTIRDEIEALCKKYKVETLVLEGLSFGSVSTSVRVLAGLYYSILIMCEELGIKYKQYSPTSVKKFATNSGKAKKKDMFEAMPIEVQERVSQQFKTIASGKYDISDAYHIGQIYLNELKQ